MSKVLEDILDSAFSLLPDAQAARAKQRLIERHRSGISAEAFELKWAEFDMDGRFLRGGISDISDLSTYIVLVSQEDRDIEMMARLAREGLAKAGTVSWVPEDQHFHWFVPFMPSSDESVLEARLRALCITEPLLGELLDQFNPDAKLTTSEKRVIFQTMGGLDLRTAADDDGVVYETKRAHIRNVNEKLGCSGQKDLVRQVFGQMMYLVSASTTDIVHAETASEFVSRHLADDMRLLTVRGSSGKLLRYLQGGPSDGVPVVMVHGMMFPVILQGVSPYLYDTNIRLIVPIRPGYLESRPLTSLYQQQDLLENGLEEIADLISSLGISPANILGNSLGASVAIRLAQRLPEKVSRLVLLSINLTRTKKAPRGRAGQFYSGLRSLTSEADVFKLVNLEFRKYYADEQMCRTILTRHFGASPADVDVLEGTHTRAPAYAMFSETYRTSVVGISEDFRFVMSSLKNAIGGLSVPAVFIHGTEDPLTEVSEIERSLGPSGDVRLVRAEGAGHFVAVSHGKDVWRTVRDVIS